MLFLLALPPAQAQPFPTGLPTHFSFGLLAQASGIYDWMPESRIPWDFAYHYLSGGVGTGQGWAGWNPDGSFVLTYARAAAQRGYTPMFAYYMLADSSGPCADCSNPRRALTNLNSPDVMNAYFADFALLMQRLGPATRDDIQGFGKPALVDVEPDLGGYAQQAVLRPPACYDFCTGQGNDGGFLKAAVHSSGYPDVGAYPDTWTGYNQALLHLRDLYAPNVLLGFDISNWATGPDVGESPDPHLDAAAYGRLAGEFAARSGAIPTAPNMSMYDLLFNSPQDRDAGQYAAKFSQNRWWDRTNASVPNFTRWEQYLSAARTAAGNKPILLWQVPIGNQYFRTEDNSDNHYQDNRAEYFFGHIPELVEAGIVGVMFGAGSAANTTNYDSGDGVTNPPAFCTSDGISSGQICNDHESIVADDDGGYLRLAAGAYYKRPLILTDSP
jgi:hypothetical protein